MAVKRASFDADMQARQIAWRHTSGNVTSADWGWQNRCQYEHILPRDDWEQGLWPGIRSDQPDSLTAYLGTDIQAHQGKHNLKSSWILCSNLYFPFGRTDEGCALLAGFLREHVSPEVRSVDALHLEYADEDDALKPAVLLGETGGNRGSGQTSPDLAFHVNGRRGLVLVENKLVEHSFYPCSARRLTESRDRPGNPDPDRRLNVEGVLADAADQCHQHACGWGRKYWDILRPVMNEPAMRSLKCCPATRAGYQLFRQQALAEGIAGSGKYDFVFSCVALDERNDDLRRCLVKTGIIDLETDWDALFSGKARFKVFTHQQWVAWVREHGALSSWQSWLSYVEDRYGY